MKDARAEALAQLLLIKFNSPQKHMRKIADDYLVMFFNKLPFLLWSSTVLRTMLDILQLLAITKPEHKHHIGSGSHSLLKYHMPNALGGLFTLQLPTNLQEREKMLNDFKHQFKGLSCIPPFSTRTHLGISREKIEKYILTQHKDIEH